MLNPDDPEHQAFVTALITEGYDLMKYFQEKDISPMGGMNIFCALIAVMYDKGDMGLKEMGMMTANIINMSKLINVIREQSNKQKE